MKKSLYIVSLALIVPSVVFSQSMPAKEPDGKKFEQMKEFKERREEFKKQREEMKVDRQKLKELIKDPKSSDADIQKLADEIAVKISTNFRNRIDKMLELRKTLPPEKFQKMLERFEERMDEKRKGH